MPAHSVLSFAMSLHLFIPIVNRISSSIALVVVSWNLAGYSYRASQQ
jgi:hypothetical protein